MTKNNLPPITAALLISKGACTDQVKLFTTTFGDGPCPLDDETAVRCAPLFDVNWAVRNLLPTSLWEQYAKVRDPAWMQYNKVRDPAWEQYNKVRDPALEQYNNVCEDASMQYAKVRDPAWEQYDKVCEAAWMQYDKVCALTFVRLYRENM